MKSFCFYSILKFFLFAKKRFFCTQLSSVADATFFLCRITKLYVHNLYTYTFLLQKKLLLYHTQGGGNFNLKSGPIFRRVNIFRIWRQFFCAHSMYLQERRELNPGFQARITRAIR